MKMAELIHLNYHLLQIISRFGIRLGFGDKTIRQVCTDYRIDVDFFLEIVKSYHIDSYLPEKHLSRFAISTIVDYLRKSHEYYVRSKVPEIAILLKQLAGIAVNVPEQTMKMIDEFFTVYKNELEWHIGREEEKVYPYVFRVEKAFLNKQPSADLVEQIKRYSIDDYEREHDNIEDKLLDLKNILIKYIPAPAEQGITQSILFELFRLERDLRDHARIEDKILVPKVKSMEKWILEHAI
jgi:regulator of cell morphogenesis and NO signaling